MNALLLSADQIVAIPLDRPDRLFSGEPGAIEHEWRTLAAEWHPDRNSGDARATAVFQHISALHGEAVRRLGFGVWETALMLRLRKLDGSSLEVPFRHKVPFELGDTFVDERQVAWVLPILNRDLFRNAIAAIGRFDYAGRDMRAEVEPRLPSIADAAEMPDRLALLVHKPDDQVRLADLVSHVGGRLDPRHAAWILGRLLSVACWLEWHGIVHAAIGPDTVFVGPRRHSLSLLGGWWYATRPGSHALIAMPDRTAAVLPPADAARGLASTTTDRELVRLTGREILGDPAGTRLLCDAAVPRPFAAWLVQPAAETALDDYRAFEAAREAAFGPPRFVDLPVDVHDVYPQP